MMCMVTKIKSVQINALRGIPYRELIFEGKNIIIKGDNGTGKSSIVQAFEYLFTGTVSSLEGTQGVSVRKNLNHINYKLSDVFVQINFNEGNMNLRRLYNVDPSPNTILTSYYEGARNGKFILTRSDMLKFVLAKPSDRFKAISSVIGIEKLDEIELDLKRYYDKLNQEYSVNDREINTHFNEISLLLNIKVKTKKEILFELNEQRKKIDLPILESIEQVGITTKEQYPSINIKDLNKYAEYKECYNNVIIRNNKFNEISLEKIVKKIDGLDKDVIIDVDKDKREFLDFGIRIMKKTKEDICPLCGSDINRILLIEEINKRMTILKQLTSEWEKIEKELYLYIIVLDNMIDNFEYILNINEKYLKNIKIIDTIKENIKIIEKLKNNLNNAIYKMVKIELCDINSISNFYNKIKEATIDKLNTIMNDIVDESTSLKLTEMLNISGKISVHVNEINKKLHNKDVLRNKLKIIKIIYNEYSLVKQKEIAAIYDNIKSEINDFYKILHPDDPHYNIDIELSRTRSTNLTIDYSTVEEIHPKAYLSEGHQDSLGLCIFLAFAKNFNQECNLLILDDVVSTIDSNHREFIGKLLNEQFSNYQHIITTHDDIWFQQLIKYMSFKRFVITNWNIKEGPIIQGHLQSWDKIRQKLDDGDKSAGGDARTYLEWILKNATFNTRTKSIIKPSGDYTVGDLFYDVKNRYKNILKNHEKKDEILTKFDELEKRNYMGNLLQHDNPISASFSIEEIERFCNSVHKLHQVLCCTGCGEFLVYPENIKRLQCPNGDCKNPTIF